MASLTDIATGVGFGAMFLCATGTVRAALAPRGRRQPWALLYRPS